MSDDNNTLAIPELTEEQREQLRSIGRDLGQAVKRLLEGIQVVANEFSKTLQEQDKQIIDGTREEHD